MGIQFPVSVSAKICILPFVVPNSYFGGLVKCMRKTCRFFACQFHNNVPGVSGKCTYASRRLLFDRVNICSRHYNLALGYGVDRIWSCGGWLA